ncbi:MAG: hypothetical protein KIT16_19300 [Rhodospirillaceae bacterium]|nr:hypothetical protein [Rhodospirillaceae bacterium]
MSRIVNLAGLALAVVAGASAMSSPAFAKACTNGICAESRSDGRMVNVYLTFRGKNWSHFNVRRNGGQLEVKPGQVYMFRMKQGYKQYYSVQVCNRGGLFQKSSCTGWVRFYHTS